MDSDSWCAAERPYEAAGLRRACRNFRVALSKSLSESLSESRAKQSGAGDACVVQVMVMD